jgi:hypothetical protein
MYDRDADGDADEHSDGNAYGHSDGHADGNAYGYSDEHADRYPDTGTGEGTVQLDDVYRG